MMRSMVTTPSGQMHVRVAGEGPAVTLLHWTPASSRQYAPVVPHLAAHGRRAMAPDHFGYGFSDPRPGRWMVKDYAASIIALWDALEVDCSALVGGHFSSEIAAEIARQVPTRVTALVLDGSPVWDRPTRDKVLATARQPAPPWAEDGSHMAWVWQRALWLQRMWDKNFKLDDAGAATIRAAMIDSLLAQQSDDSAEALRAYDLVDCLPRITVPTLAITATGDPLTNCHADVLALVPGVQSHVFDGTHPLHDAARVESYARVLLDFFGRAEQSH